MGNESLKEQLYKLLNCDLRQLYPTARNLNRKLYFFVGPTNSGKTYQAMQELLKADTGTYLAPLRLLALENYEYLKENNIPASLVTGEEEIFDEEAAHICSTIEMLNYDLEVDVSVIDEIQMLEDKDRGWAWVNAIVGTPAKKVIMTGSVNALDAVKKIASYLNEEIEIVKFKRKTKLEVLNNHTPLKNIKPNTALIAFSRNDVLKLKNKLYKFHNMSVIYGNLSPEVRRDEAKKFRDGQNDILIATDAIAMGLNLPIETILFTTHTKFDGISKRQLTPNEIVQIVGRAGRYKQYECGYIGATSKKDLEYINEKFNSPLRTIKPPFYVKATLSQVESISSYLNTKSLYKVLKYFAKNMNFEGPFKAANLSIMLELSQYLDTKSELSLEQKYILSQAPISVKSPLIKSAYYFYVDSIIKNKVVHYKQTSNIKNIAKTQLELLRGEDEVKKISLYLWLSYKLPLLFPDNQKAIISRSALNHYCEKSLQSAKLTNNEQKDLNKKQPRHRNTRHTRRSHRTNPKKNKRYY